MKFIKNLKVGTRIYAGMAVLMAAIIIISLFAINSMNSIGNELESIVKNDIPQTTKVIHDSRVAAVTITASVNAGRAVAAEAGKALKKCVLEVLEYPDFILPPATAHLSQREKKSENLTDETTY
jgi:hypothetical protein